MEKKSLKNLRLAADEMAAAEITNREALFAALPTLIQIQDAVANQRKALAAAVKAATMLSISGINEANPTAEELAEHGLAEKPHDVWSLCTEA